MKATDLMIGDWVLYAGEDERLKNKPVQVTGICMEIMQGSFSKEMYEVLSYGKIKPIPIEEDILERNGWVGAGDNMFVKQPYRITKADKVWGVAIGIAYIAEIRYVHELQNIMRMTGYQGGFKV